LEDSSMTPGMCLAYCKQRNFKFYATQFATYCFCGDTYGKYGSTAYTECNLTCGGDQEVDCGGTWRNSIYSVQQSFLPEPAMPSTKYSGKPRLVVPTARSDLRATEEFALSVFVFSSEAPASVVINWRPMGSSNPWNTQAMTLKTPGRQVYTVALNGLKQDFEYFVTASVTNTNLYFPATYPPTPHTVIVA